MHKLARIALLGLLASSAFAQAPRLEGFEFNDGAVVRTGEAVAGDNLLLHARGCGPQAELRILLGDEACMVLSIMKADGNDRILVSLPTGLKKGSHEIKAINSQGESNTLRLKIIDADERPPPDDGSTTREEYMTLGTAFVREEGGRVAIVCPGSSRFPDKTELTGELHFFDEIIMRSGYKVAGDQSFELEFAMEPGVKLRPGHYTIVANFNFRSQRRRHKRVIEQALGDDNSEYSLITKNTLVTHRPNEIAAADEVDKLHYAEMCDLLERASRKLDAAFGAASKIHGQTDEGFDEDQWWKFVRRSTECLPYGLSTEERDAIRAEWLDDERFTRGRSDVRFDDRAWRDWMDDDFRGDTPTGLGGMADTQADHTKLYSFAAFPDAGGLLNDAMAVLLNRSAKYSINLYRKAGKEIDAKDKSGRLFSSFEGQGSDTSRSTFDQLLQKIRHRLRLPTAEE